MHSHCIYCDPHTGDLHFLSFHAATAVWETDTSAMDTWRRGFIRLYSIADDINTWISSDSSSIIHWTRLPDHIPPPIRLFHHGIPQSSIIRTPDEDSALTLEALTQQLTDGPVAEHPLFDLQIPTLGLPDNFFGPVRPHPIVPRTPLIQTPQIQTPPQIQIQQIQTPPTQIQQIQSLPPHVAALVIRDAVASGNLCPITMEPLNPETATVTPCGHVFQAAALHRWLRTSSTCPECREAIG